jgi:hypothetical protein
MARTPLTRPWTDEEIKSLRQMLASGANARTVAVKLRRNVNGIRSKIAKLHARDREQAQQSARKPDKPSPARVNDGAF